MTTEHGTTMTIQLQDLFVSTGPWMQTDLGPVSPVVPVGTLVEEWVFFDGNTGKTFTRFSVAPVRRDRPGGSWNNRSSWTARWWIVTQCASVRRFDDVITEDYDAPDGARHSAMGHLLGDTITLTLDELR